MDHNNFDNLLSAYLSGDTDVRDEAELSRLLSENGVHRRRLVEVCLVDVHLRKVFEEALSEEEEGVVTATPSRDRRAPTWFWKSMAAVILVGVVFLFWKPGFRRGAPSPDVVAGHVQIAGEKVVYIPVDKPFEVIGDAPATIRFTDGSSAELKPKSKASILGSRGKARQVITLSEGSGTFQVTHGGGEFLVETPAGTVTVLGTSFSLELLPLRLKAAAKATLALRVIVNDGSVRVDADGQSQVLFAGNARVFGDDGQLNQKDDGQQNQKDDGQQNQKDDGQQNNE